VVDGGGVRGSCNDGGSSGNKSGQGCRSIRRMRLMHNVCVYCTLHLVTNQLEASLTMYTDKPKNKHPFNGLFSLFQDNMGKRAPERLSQTRF